MIDAVSNTPELSVTELSGALKRTVEDAFGHVRLRGELSGFRGPHSSGHVYFSLKDAGAKIDAVIWKGVYSRVKFRPEDGMEVIATGRISTFPGKSSYQIIVESMEPAGVGALLAQLEERRRRLAAEGLFSPDRKQALPFLPAVIGIVTSPTGAVIRDMIHRISDRFARPVLVWPVRVQGEGSAEEVAAAIRGFCALPISPKSGPRFSGEADGPSSEPLAISPKSGPRFSGEADGPSSEPLAISPKSGPRLSGEADGPSSEPLAISPKSGPRFSGEADGPSSEPLAISPKSGPRFSGEADGQLVRPDVLVIARGGGSLEDLWSFNEEIVLRAAAECTIPLVSAIGHETDWTLLDQVADIRAPTPTAAAEMIVPVRAELLADLREAAARLLGASSRLQDRRRRDLAALARALPAPERALEAPRQRVDRAGMRLETLTQAALDKRRIALAKLAHRLSAQAPAARLAQQRERFKALSHRLIRAMQTRVVLEKRDALKRRGDLATAGGRLRPALNAHQKRMHQRFLASANMLNSLSYKSVLARGYAVVRDEGGILSQAAKVSAGMTLGIEFADGTVSALAGGKPPAISPATPRASRAKSSGGNQGSLF